MHARPEGEDQGVEISDAQAEENQKKLDELFGDK